MPEARAGDAEGAALGDDAALDHEEVGAGHALEARVDLRRVARGESAHELRLELGVNQEGHRLEMVLAHAHGRVAP